MVAWKLKSCPRCGGDIFIARGVDGWYEQCLQCSYLRELKDMVETHQQARIKNRMASNVSEKRV